jgi:hypothetical protein
MSEEENKLNWKGVGKAILLVGIIMGAVIIGICGIIFLNTPTEEIPMLEEDMDFKIITISVEDIEIVDKQTRNVSIAIPQYSWIDGGFEGFDYGGLPYHFVLATRKSLKKTHEIWFRERYWNSNNATWMYFPMLGPYYVSFQDADYQQIVLNRYTLNVTTYYSNSLPWE